MHEAALAAGYWEAINELPTNMEFEPHVIPMSYPSSHAL
jgi:hypothetical protein